MPNTLELITVRTPTVEHLRADERHLAQFLIGDVELPPDAPERATEATYENPFNRFRLPRLEAQPEFRSRTGLLKMLFGPGEQPAPWPPLHVSLEEGETLVLSDTWHAIHFLLTQQAGPVNLPLGMLVSAGEPLHADPEDHTAPRAVDHAVVAQLAHEINTIGNAEGLLARFDPERMDELDIQPGAWSADADFNRSHVQEFTEGFVAYIADAASKNLGLLIRPR